MTMKRNFVIKSNYIYCDNISGSRPSATLFSFTRKLESVEQHYVQIFRTEFHVSWKISLQRSDRYSGTRQILKVPDIYSGTR